MEPWACCDEPACGALTTRDMAHALAIRTTFAHSAFVANPPPVDVTGDVLFVDIVRYAAARQ
eukprot:7949506-Pyramimonas_sp.AAC.1